MYIKFKSLLFLSLFLLFLSVGAISAADLNETNDVIELDSNNIIDSTVNNSDSHGTFNDLQNEINNAPTGSVLYLSKDYDADSNAVIHLDKDLTIDGQGHTLNANYECYVFDSESGNIILKNLKLINGYNYDIGGYGGAIHIAGTAQYTLENCDFCFNTVRWYGGAIYNSVDKDLTIKNCTFYYNRAFESDGGAVYSKGPVYAYDSLFQFNSALDGGAIFGKTDAFISNCIFLSNAAKHSSISFCKGGAIYSRNVNINNSTFKDNSATDDGGAIWAFNVYINVNQNNTQEVNSFFINNTSPDDCGGAIYAYTSLNAVNVKFLNNFAGYNGGACYCGHGANITNCQFTSNKASGSICNPRGGAIFCGDGVEIKNSSFIDNYALNDGGAIYAEYININNNLATEPFNCFFMSNRVGDNNGGALYATAYINAVNTIFHNNAANVDGGAAYAENHISVRHCLFEINQATLGCGGAIRCEGGVVIKNSTFNNNFAKEYGGAIYAEYIDINNNLATEPFNCFFSGNSAGDENGGALYATAYINAVNTVFDNNAAKVDGGAAYSEYNINVRNCLFEFNQANGAVFASCYGGALCAENDATINNCTFRNNYAENKGGAIYASTVTLKNNNTFEGNSAKDYGGAIYTDKFTDDVKYAIFDDNEAQTGDGGAIYINCENHITFSQCKFINNKADDNGGAIYLDSSKSKVSLINNYFEGNSADDGQVIFNCGEYQQIQNNFWLDENPSPDNNLITENRFIKNEHYGDSDPLKWTLYLSFHG